MRHIRLKTFIRNQAIGILKDSSEDTEARKWPDLLTLKLFYALIFTAVVERVYVKCAITTLSAMSVDRAEQFTLSLLIHYPQYLLWAIMSGLFAVLVLHCILCCVGKLEESLYRRITRKDSGLEPERTEGPHD